MCCLFSLFPISFAIITMFVYDRYFKEKEHNIIGFLICFITYVLLMLVFLCNKCPCCLCEILLAIDGFLIWIYCEILNFYNNKEDKYDLDDYITKKNIGGVKEWVLKKILTKKTLKEEERKEENKINATRNKTDDLLSMAKILIETAKNNTTITFSELCDRVLQEEWKGRKWLNYIARRLDIIGHCCAYDADNEEAYDKDNIAKCFPFLNGLTREKYSYKINRGFWQPFWKHLLPIKSYEEQTEENVEEFQKQICDKINEMNKEEKEKKINEFLEKLKTFEPKYKELKNNNKS